MPPILSPMLQEDSELTSHTTVEPIPTLRENQAHGADPRETNNEPLPLTSYTTLTKKDKSLLTLLLGIVTIISPLTATIYLPLLPLLRSHFETSAQAINITITLYIIFQALSPAIFGPLSDSAGRRPIYLITLVVYWIANVGLAANRSSYSALLLLRALQSLGASAASAVSYGVISDVCVHSERGRMIGPVSMMLNLGACIGPVIGGWVAYSSGSFEWVFWALVIIAAILVAAVGAFLPETARTLVGNGSRNNNPQWWESSWLDLALTATKERGKSKSEKAQDSSPKGDSVERWKRLRIHNPFSCLRMIFHYDTFLVLWMHGSFYTVDASLIAAIPDILKNTYHFNELYVGLSYLPRGVGIILGGYVNGKLMDYNYRVTAEKLGWTVDRVSGDDMKHFPIEKARSRGGCWLLIVSTATLLGYGWAVHAGVHFSVLLVLQFVQGFWGTMFYTIYNTLLVDVFPESPSTAAAAASISRCAMAATGIAILQPLLDGLGYGWYFTVLGLWSGVFGMMAVFLIRRNGMKWRSKRVQRSERTTEQ